MLPLTNRYKYAQKALTALNIKNCVKYQSLNMGEYSFETSNISTKKWGSDNKTLIKDELKKAKQKYESDKSKL